jgi:hypothetical protein
MDAPPPDNEPARLAALRALDLKRVEEELLISRQRLDLIFRSIKVGLWDNELPFGNQLSTGR